MTDIELDEATLWQVEREGYDIDDSVAFHGPPGTGKTTTAAATVGRLLRDHDYDISDVCWVTYRRSLARDTLERLAQWDVLDEGQLNEPRKGATRYIGTAHAVGNRCSDIADEPVEPWHRKNFCEDRGMQYWTAEPWEDSAGKLLFSVFDYLANQHKTPEDTEALHTCPRYSDLRNEWRGDVISAWHEWQDYKAQRRLIDFHEMLSRPLENGNTPGRPILVIDEYHDVTGLMHQLFKQWMDDAEIVLVAGDPHQVVNAFDGASPEYFESLDLPTVLLPKSWRCPEQHWDVATSLLANAHNVPDVEVGGEGLVNQYNSPRFEYSSDMGWVTLPGEDQPASPGRIEHSHDGSTLFLSRTQMQADGVGAALERAGIPYLSQPDLKGWNTENGATRRRLYNALQTVKGYSPGSLDYGGNTAFSQFQDGEKDPRSASLTTAEAADTLDAVNAKVLDMTRGEAKEKAEELRDAEGELSLNEFDNHVTREFWEQYTSGASSVDRLNKTAFGTDARREKEALRSALNKQEGRIEAEDIDTWAITIHASKGMEADDVVVYDGISRTIQQGMRESDRTHRNEYRTWYVALSRGKKRIHVMRNAFEWTNPIIPEDLGA